MSHSTYNDLWADAQSTLGDLLPQEEVLESAKPEKDKDIAFHSLAGLYVNYVAAVIKLDQCYDQIVHPQKRRFIRKLLDATLARVLELKHELVNLEFSEFIYFEDILADLKMTPREVEIPIPRYFLQENLEDTEKRSKMVDDALRSCGLLEEELHRGPNIECVEDAVRQIQIHERARQGRLRARFMREIRRQEERERLREKGVPTMDKGTAVLLIQRVWRGYATRKKVKNLKEDEMMFIGMIPAPASKYRIRDTAAEVVLERRETQRRHETEFQEALVSVKEQMRISEGPDMKESMQDRIREWFIHTKEQTSKFPDYPSEEDGGSYVIFNPTSGDDSRPSTAMKEEKEKKTKDKKSKDKKEKEKDVKKGSKKKGEDEGEDTGFKMQPSAVMQEFRDMNKMYKEKWKNLDESSNIRQGPAIDMIKDEKRRELEVEIRQQVDVLMRNELEQLKNAVERDKGKKGKKGKKSGKKKRKGKKAGKKGKKKKDKDLTPDRTLESLLEELALNGIIRNYPKLRLSEYIGDVSYMGTQLKKAGKEPLPSPGDIRRVIAEVCILPLGSPAAREMCPPVKSILLAGPHGTGKNMLVYSICTELGAVLFDLTATTIAGKYPGKAGLNMLLHLVNKVSRLMQPAVIFIDNAERTFIKKVPKTDKTDPKRLKKDLPKLVKGVGPEDRILLIGASSCPWDCDQKGLSQAYQKMLLLPRPDYASRFLIWRDLLLQTGSKADYTFDYSSLAKISDGYTAGNISEAIRHVLTDRRISKQISQPLIPLEFVGALAKMEPVYKEEDESFVQWYAKTPLGKKRAKALEGDEPEESKKGKKGMKGIRGGKKK